MIAAFAAAADGLLQSWKRNVVIQAESGDRRSEEGAEGGRGDGGAVAKMASDVLSRVKLMF